MLFGRAQIGRQRSDEPALRAVLALAQSNSEWISWPDKTSDRQPAWPLMRLASDSDWRYVALALASLGNCNPVRLNRRRLSVTAQTQWHR
jgi:hypothetical protein